VTKQVTEDSTALVLARAPC